MHNRLLSRKVLLYYNVMQIQKVVQAIISIKKIIVCIYYVSFKLYMIQIKERFDVVDSEMYLGNKAYNNIYKTQIDELVCDFERRRIILFIIFQCAIVLL